ncbi:N-acetylmuramoyl-L-alanine amidase, partial [Streptomyces sp. NPDC005009]
MREPATEPRRAAGPSRRATRGALCALAAAALTLPLLGAAPTPASPSSARLQHAFATAAAEYDVPQSVLLGVSYLQSRWDAHAGAPSVTGGYGPMHLTDARTALAASDHHASGAEDPRGDEARPSKRPEARAARTEELPARLTTLPRAARLTGLSPERLREDPAANVAGGAALLADAQRRLGEPKSDDPAARYAAGALVSGAVDTASATPYA